MESSATLSPTLYDVSASPKSKLNSLMQGVMRRPERSNTNTTFFIDSDVDSDSETGESFEEPSPVDDLESLGRRSTSASSPADLGTPQSQHVEHSPNLIYRLKSIKRGRKHSGAEEELCFRATMASGQLDWESYQPDPPTEPVPAIPARLRAQSPEAHQTPAQEPTAELENGVQGVRRWSTQQVAAWMLNSGFENSIISSFQTHDINGAVLLDLGFDDLRDLDIPSYGKRQQIWNEIGALRFDGMIDDPPFTSNTGPQRVPSCVDVPSNGASERAFFPEYQRSKQARSRASSASTDTVIQRGKSPSGAAQEIPKPHRCSKGNKCAKWQKQQTALEEVDKVHGPNTPPTQNPADMSQNLTTVPTSSNAAVELDSTPVPPPSVDPVCLPEAPRPLPAVKQPLEFQQIVQSSLDTANSSTTQSSNSSGTVTTRSRIEPFPQSPLSPVFIYPPRQSSRNILPRLSIPPSPTGSRHTPSNSDSSIINVYRTLSHLTPTGEEQRPARSTSVPPPVCTQQISTIPTLMQPSSPPSIVAPIMSTKPTGLRSPSPASASKQFSAPISSFARSGSPSPYSPRMPGPYAPSIQDSSSSTPPSESVPLVPAPLFGRSTTPSPDPSNARLYGRSTTPSPDLSGMRNSPSITGRRPPMLRAPLSADTLVRRRNVTPLPTLQETSSKKSHRVSKPLPATPRKSTSSDEAAPPAPAPPVSTATKPFNAPPVPPMSARHEPPPTPMRPSPTKTSTATPTPTTANSMLASPQPSLQTPATPFTPMTPMTPKTPAPFSATSSVPSLPSLPTKLPRQAYGDNILRVGWVRRRRARLWRHEWTSAHVRLTNTHLSIHATANPSDTTPLDSIDVDDYVVACSSIAGGGGTGGKLAAAVRSLRIYSGGNSTSGSSRSGMMGSAVLGAGDAEGGGGAFSWQLVPAAAVGEKSGHVRTEKNGDGEETTIVVKNASPNMDESASPTKDVKSDAKDKEKEKEKVVLRTHHFAVKTRDERIDWMREVMLAKALRQKELAKRAEGVEGERPVTRAGSF